jgi:nucleotide-binding universal stress UspA family protein
MAADIKPGWSKPSNVLFASEFPANEKAFAFALSQANEFGAELIIFHVVDRYDLQSQDHAIIRGNDYAAVRAAKLRLEPLCRRAKDIGIRCKIVIRLGWPADRILAYLRDHSIDRVVMGAHSPGPVGKLLVGSVAEAVLRNANAPVCIVGPHVAEDSYRSTTQRKILCDLSKQHGRLAVAGFGAALAASHGASLVLYRVVSPHERDDAFAGRTAEQLESELLSAVSPMMRDAVRLRTKVAVGDPVEELLYQGRSQHAHLMVLGAQGASPFAAATRAGTVYKILAYAHCPVVIMSPVLLAQCGAMETRPASFAAHYTAGVI